MKLPRLLAWEVVLIHLLTGTLFTLVVGILLANAGLEQWWVIGLLTPLALFSWAGWTYEGWIIWKGTAELRRNGGIRDD